MFMKCDLDSDLDSVAIVLQAAIKWSLKYKNNFIKSKMSALK